MRRKRIATKHFGGVVDITDPCYDKDVWCRMTAEVKDGEYDCLIWVDTKKCYTVTGKEYLEKRVGVIGIYLNGVIPTQKSMKEIGNIGVDAGLAGFFMNKPDYDDKTWTEICESLGYDECAWMREEGFFSSSGYGDGCYPVYAGMDKENNITSLEIRFM